MNYELIYKIRKGRHATDSLSNLEVQFCNAARAKAKEAHQSYRAAIAKLVGHERFEVTNICCMADGILGHVYAWEEGSEPKSGNGKKRCIFCNFDDFDF